MTLQEIYEKAPNWLQSIAINVMGISICRRRYNKQFYKELKRFEKNEYDQNCELREFLLAIRNVEAYKDVFSPQLVEMLKAKDCDVFSVLAKFPIIGKLDVKEHIDDYVNKDYSGKTFTMRTSGTTGSGLAFPYPVEFENKQWAIWWQYRRKWGIELDTWCGWFGGKRIMSPNRNKPPYWQVNCPGHQVMYSSYHLTQETVRLFYEDLEKRGLRWIHGYPSHISKLAALILEKEQPLYSIKWVTTGAEGLVGNQLRLIRKAFPNAMIGEHYGQNEGVAIMNRDSDRGWETVDRFSYIEFIPIDRNNPDLCRIVGTGFFNRAFPLVRYDTGDLATVERGSDGQIVKILSIDGRTSNTIKQPSGHEITEAALSIVLHDFDSIKEAQFHQVASDSLELWVVKGKDYSAEDEKNLMTSLKKAFDDNMTVSIKYVEAVERTKTGKLRLVITES